MDIGKILEKHKLRITRPRQEIFETLRSAARPLSEVEIAAATPTVDPVTVYRTIELFLKLEVVVGVAHGWKQRYELAAPFRPHHHHILCTNCSRVEEISSEKLEEFIRRLGLEYGFQVTGHTFEITGRCSNCN
jgi:Fur family ferric uptake transcriptional regulator